MDITHITWSALGGILPALVWLVFWLRVDKKRPEPKGKIVATFILGMLATLLVLPVEGFLEHLIGRGSILLVLLWSFAEELFKYIAAFFAGLHTKANNEPIDAIIYLLTAALGFAAMENMLFLLTPIGDGLLLDAIITGNMRFIGASVLHTLSSGTIGVFIALSFYRKREMKKIYIFSGLILATLLHTLFNLLIINKASDNIFGIFVLVWVAVAILLIFFEKAKQLRP